MGKIKQGILGGFSGSVAGVVGSSWKGIAVIKSKPLSVANPKTASQTSNRNAFKSCAQAASKLLTNIVKPLWDRNAQRQSGYNAFVSANKAAFDGDGLATPADFVQTQGKLAETAIDSISIVAAQKNVVCNWTDDQGEGEKLGTDVAYVVAYNANNNEWAQSSGLEVRGSESDTVSFETDMEVDDVISVYLTFASADGFRFFKGSSDLSNTVQ